MNWLSDFFTLQVLGPVISVIVTAIIGWIAVLYTKITGSDLDAGHRIALQSALENGIRGAIQLILNGKLSADGTVPAEKRSAVIGAASQYVKTSVPEALAHFDINDRKLNDLLMPKLPNSGDQQKTAKATPVEVVSR